MLNSIIVSLLTVVVVVIIAAMTGYGFGKKRFPGSGVLFCILLSTMFLPSQVMLIPLFILVRSLHLTDTLAGSYLAMALPMLSSPFGIFLVKQFASTIPDELIDAAKIDGASEWQIFIRIAVPIMAPALFMIVFFLAFQQYFVKGITFGAVKG